MEQIRLGTIGSGVIVHNVVGNLVKMPNLRVVAVYSRSRQKGEQLAAKYDAGKVYTDIDAFLADPDINTVYIATPNLLHYEQAKRALLAGKHVILEKPFCTTLRRARELADISRNHNLMLVDAVPPSFSPNFRLLGEKIPEIGKIKLVMTNFSQYSSRYDLLLRGELPNIFNPALGGGCLMDLNFYNIYLNVALFGKPVEVTYYPNFYPGAADTSGLAVLRYEGFVSQNAAAKDTWGVNFVQIEGEKGYIYADDGSAALSKIRVVTRDGSQKLNLQDNPDRWYYEAGAVAELLLAEDRAELDRRLDVMLDVMEILEKARISGGLVFPGDEE